MDPEAVRAYARRPWDELRRAKDLWWGEAVRERGPTVALRAAWALREHMKAVRPGWPDAAERERDLAHHVELRRLLDLASRALAGR